MRKLLYKNLEWEYKIGKRFVLVRNKSNKIRILVKKENCPSTKYWLEKYDYSEFVDWYKSDGTKPEYANYLATSITPNHIRKLIDYYVGV